MNYNIILSILFLIVIQFSVAMGITCEESCKRGLNDYYIKCMEWCHNV